MPQNYCFKLICLVLSAMVLMISSCSSPPEENKHDKVTAFVSIPPQAFFVDRIGGEFVDTRVLVGEGKSPHSFEPTPRQMAELSSADIYFLIGVPFEKHIHRKLSSTHRSIFFSDSGRKIERIPEKDAHNNHEKGEVKEPEEENEHTGHHSEDELDPHVWLSPRNAIAISRAVCEDLIEIDPEHKETYSGNLDKLIDDLEKLDERISRAMAPFRGEKFFVFHPAFGYFAREYGLEQVSVETGGREPGPKTLSRVIDQAKSEGVKIIFVQPQFPEKSARTIASEIGGTVVPIDPLARDYLENMGRIADRVSKAIEKDPGETGHKEE